MKTLLAYLRALYQFYQSTHWKSSGDHYYADHLLYQRLYEGVQEELDEVAEKLIGISGETNAVEPVNSGETAVKFLAGMIDDDTPASEFPQRAIAAEKKFLDMIDKIMNDGVSNGVEDLLQGICNTHETHLYLLQQRHKKAHKKMAETQNIIKVSGAEVFGNVTVDVVPFSGNSDKVLPGSKTFEGTTFQEVSPQAIKYARELQRKYHPARVESTLPTRNSYVLDSLASLANKLDKKGYYNEASKIDEILKGETNDC